ncbi:MAG: hypothetical protein LBU42_05105 [Prevotellaceae bacterium]|jgi:hypothetical protein|nr:hypothetical protein [Prevotellaceae bacterium]
MDLTTQEILSMALTGTDEGDAAVGSQLLKGHTHRIKRFKGDGAYDKLGFRRSLEGGVEQVIPPPKGAVARLSPKGETLPAHLVQRNEAVRYIQQHSLPKWKITQGDHQRSLNEVVMFRYKTIFGGELKVRTAENQVAEVKLKCLLLNTFREIGMPISYKVA